MLNAVCRVRLIGYYSIEKSRKFMKISLKIQFNDGSARRNSNIAKYALVKIFLSKNLKLND